MLSLPRAFATMLETIPADVPYLSPPADAVAQWRARLAGSELKVGIAWAGSALHRSDAQRSIDVETLASLLDVKGVRWFSLQVGARAPARWPRARLRPAAARFCRDRRGGRSPRSRHHGRYRGRACCRRARPAVLGDAALAARLALAARTGGHPLVPEPAPVPSA